MIKKLFIGPAKPRLEYASLQETPDIPADVQPSKHLIYHLRKNENIPGKSKLEKGDPVKIGQKILPTDTSADFFLSSCCGTISDISDLTGTHGQNLTSITIDINNEQISGTPQQPALDDNFQHACKNLSIENGAEYCVSLPGKPDLSVFNNPESSIQTIVVLGLDDELLCTTNQYFIKNHMKDVKAGIDLLGKLSGINDIILIVPSHLQKEAASSRATVKTIDNEYPHANRELIRDNLSTPGKNRKRIRPEVAFFTAEAVCALANLAYAGKNALLKKVTFLSRDGNRKLISAPIGTPITDILECLDQMVSEGDRIIIGGPMKGTAVYSADFPVAADTDMIMVQAAEDVQLNDDVACINCGACVRNCPANIQVNQMIRLLEASQYEEAAENYHLFCCIECGLCSYVCEARIAIFQHIKLAKQTLEGTETYEKYA